MTVRLIEWQVPYTWGTAIEITADKVINLLLRAENNLLHVNDDNELYCDLQLENWIAVDDDLPVWVTTGIVNESDGRPQNGLLLHYETTSWAYAQRLYGGDGKLYFNWWTWERKLVYYAEDVDQLLQELHDELVEQLTMNAWEWIEILNRPDYSAMRWPCPEWFHVFKYAEQVSLQEMMVTLWIDNNPVDYLKVPLTWFRNSWSSWEVAQSGASTSFWSVDSAWWSLQSIHTTYIKSDRIRTNNVSNRWAGNVIRPIKDVPVIPNNTWTILFDWSSIATGAWVYHSPELGLISISDDWQNRITIADKNLGATVVYNNGDALSDANCGNLYQWWNNYWFTHDWTVTTSYDKVDTTWYGPWNYYYGTTFILTNLSTDDYGDWSEEINDNLWGGVTWVQDLHNVITNTWVLSVNWKKGHVIVADNVKAFRLENNQDLDTAQEIYERWVEWKEPIVIYKDNQFADGYRVYYYSHNDWGLVFISVKPTSVYYESSWYNSLCLSRLNLSIMNERVISINKVDESILDYIRLNTDYPTPYIPPYAWSPATKKYVDDFLRIFPLWGTTPQDAQPILDWILAWHKAAINYNWSIYLLASQSSQNLVFYDMNFDIRKNTNWIFSDLMYSQILIQYSTDTVTSVMASRTSRGWSFLTIDANYSGNFLPLVDGDPTNKYYVDKLGPCVPVYHLGGWNVMTSYINFDMAGWTYKIKIQWYHGTTINRTITVTASSTVQGTFTSNLMEHYNYWCIVTIDPSVSTTMIIQIDSNSNFSVDDIYIEKINIQSWIVTATSIN